MKRWTLFAALFVAVIAVTCSYNPPPVPVEGDAATLGFLAGEWSGEYESEDTGRSGNVFFRLQAGADVAQGEVLMTRLHDIYPSHPVGTPQELEMPQAVKAPPVVAISFVRATGDWVYGTLDEYRDPECGCPLQTTFTGRVVRDHLEGTFTTRHLDSGERHGGTWTARRTGPPPRLEAEAEDVVAAPPGPVVDEPGLGPDEAEMIAQGRQLFQELGCSFCHGAEDRPTIGPDLEPALQHRSFSWVYRMILNPDSMVKNDPVAKGMYEAYGFEMPERGATPWEALVLYEYLIAETLREPPRER